MKKSWIIIISIISFIILIVLYSRFIGTSGIKVKEYKVLNENLTNNFHGLKIVHISDLHYGRVINKNNIDEVVKKINATEPDVILLTGDLLDRDTKISDSDLTILKENLLKIDASLGKYAIMGNHDYSHKDWNIIITEGNFINLNDTYTLIYKNSTTPILLAGLSTNIKIETPIETKMNQVATYLQSLTNENAIIPAYKILMMHEPDYIDKVDYDSFDLVLAGHSHNGQVRLPLIGPILLPKGAKNYYDEYYKLNNTDMYISGGLGTSILNFRLFNKPSFNLYRITNK